MEDREAIRALAPPHPNRGNGRTNKRSYGYRHPSYPNSVSQSGAFQCGTVERVGGAVALPAPHGIAHWSSSAAAALPLPLPSSVTPSRLPCRVRRSVCLTVRAAPGVGVAGELKSGGSSNSFLAACAKKRAGPAVSPRPRPSRHRRTDGLADRLTDTRTHAQSHTQSHTRSVLRPQEGRMRARERASK